jgi:hypothetical protein
MVDEMLVNCGSMGQFQRSNQAVCSKLYQIIQLVMCINVFIACSSVRYGTVQYTSRS